MDAYIDFLLKHIKPYSGNFSEPSLFVNKRWQEFRDDEDFHESVLFIFQDDGEGTLLQSIDGNIGHGSWQVLDKKKTMIIESAGKKQKSELFDLAFLNKEFFVLKKHGNQKRIDKKKYLVFALEGANSKLDWVDLMEKMYELYSKNWLYSFLVVAFLFLLAIMIFSIFI